MRIKKTLILSIAAIAVLSVGTLYLLRDPLPHFMARRSALTNVREGESREEGGYVSQAVKLTARSGLVVDLVVSRALADSGARLPVVLLLGGHSKGPEAVRLLGDHRGVAIAATSYPYSGNLNPSAITFLRQIPAIRRAFLDTPPAMMLALDYLLPRPDIDSTRVEGIGVSLGAPFVCIAGALDSRLKRVWALQGSGGSYAPLESSMKRSIPSRMLRVPAAALANVIIAGPRLDPDRWVGQISPRPFVMVNAIEDERMPRDKVESLYGSARQPKQLIWMGGGHIHGDVPTIRRLVAIVLPRVRAGIYAPADTNRGPTPRT